MENSQNDLERKVENAIAARLKQQPLLARLRMRRTSEDSAKVNQDLTICAKRGEGNPPFSGIYSMEVSCTYSMHRRNSVTTLPVFLRMCAAMEEVFNVTAIDMAGGVPVQRLAAQLSLSVPDFHCYEVAVTGKDDTPEDMKHKCVWTLSLVAMGQSYVNAGSIQSNS